MKLNRNNYEEYFILYLDNELGSEDRLEVEVFAKENPDLSAELDMLLQSKLSPDTDLIFTNKEVLLARDSSSINLNNYEQWLLSYIDDELTPEERKDVEQFVALNSSMQKELGLLQQLKLQAEAIVFPNKESLYRKEEEQPRVIPIRWWRLAAAAVLLLAISTTAIVLINNKPVKYQDGVANVDPKTEKSPEKNNIKQPENITTPGQQTITGNEPKKTEPLVNEQPVNTVAVKRDNIISKERKEQGAHEIKQADIVKGGNEQRPSNNLPQALHNPNVEKDANNANAYVPVPPKQSSLTNNKETQDATAVTTPASDTYNKGQKAEVKQDNPDAIYASDNTGKKNKLRGFFRKITRTFEKRTNIKATDGEDDDRLLIAGLSIKLN